MIIRPCRCGATPAAAERLVGLVHIVQMKCTCGARGATLMYTKPEDRARMIQAAHDGWNLGDTL